MTQENLEIVRAFYPSPAPDLVQVYGDEKTFAAFEARLAPMIGSDSLLMPDPELASMMGTNDGSSYTGLDAINEAWRDWLSAWESFRIELEELVPLDDRRTLSLIVNHAKPKGGSSTISFPGGAIFTIEDRKVRQLELFLNRDRAREAAGM